MQTHLKRRHPSVTQRQTLPVTLKDGTPQENLYSCKGHLRKEYPRFRDRPSGHNLCYSGKIKEANEKWICSQTDRRVEHAKRNAYTHTLRQRDPLSHPLASIKGATNAVSITTDNLGEVTIIGPGAGRRETGQAL